MQHAPHAPYASGPALRLRAAVWRHSLASACAGASLWAVLPAPAHAVLTNVEVGSAPRSITLQVGSPGGTIDNVVFDVTGANVSPTPVPVTNPATVGFSITANRVTSTGTTVTLTAYSSTGLPCVAGTGCGTTVIPFNKIRWTSLNPSNTGLDIQDGIFDGSAGQPLASYPNNVRRCTLGAFLCFIFGNPQTDFDTNLQNNLRFTYDNDMLYPAGQYRGRVTFTATMP